MNRVEYNNTLFPEFMFGRISALHNTYMLYLEKNPELSLLLKYRSWTRDEIHAHFYSIEYMSNLHLCMDENEISTKYDHFDSYFYLQFLDLIAGDEPHHLLYQKIKGTEYGIFEFAEPSDRSSNGGSGNESPFRNVFTTENRPKLEGPIIRKMYQGADYLSAGRALTVGLIEAKDGKKVIWLSEEERQNVLQYIYNRRKKCTHTTPQL